MNRHHRTANSSADSGINERFINLMSFWNFKSNEQKSSSNNKVAQRKMISFTLILSPLNERVFKTINYEFKRTERSKAKQSKWNRDECTAVIMSKRPCLSQTKLNQTNSANHYISYLWIKTILKIVYLVGIHISNE